MKKHSLGIYSYLGEKLEGEQELLLKKLHQELMAKRGADLLKKPLIRVNKKGCWIWYNLAPRGYGDIYWDGRNQKTHRVSYELLIGVIPKGLFIDHLCRNRGCCNPNHLEPVTMLENLLRGRTFCARNTRKKRCLRGHIFKGDNLYLDKRGWRCCRKCLCIYRARYRAKIKALATHPDSSGEKEGR